MNYEILSVARVKEIEQLRRKYKKALEILTSYGIPCERIDFIEFNSDYCVSTCEVDDDVYKYCWDKYIEWSIGNN